MGLRERKIIQNAKVDTGLNKYKFGEDLIVALGGGLLDFAGRYAAGTNSGATVGGLLSTGRRSQSYTDGIGYDVISPLDALPAEDQLSAQTTANILGMAGSAAATGASVAGIGGAIVGGIGGLVGGIFSGDLAKKDLEHKKWMAEVKRKVGNAGSYFVAENTALLNKYARNNGDLEKQQLYPSKNGLEPPVDPNTNETVKKYNVQTVHGTDYDFANGLAKPNEYIVRGNEYHKVKGTPGDTNMIRIDKNRDGIISRESYFRNPETGRQLAKDVPLYAHLGRLQDLLSYQAAQKSGLIQAKNGYIPKYKLGAELIPSLFNAGIGIRQIIAANDELSSPRSYMPNLYERDAIRTLRQNRVNVLPIYNNNMNVEARGRDAIVNSGGLGAGQIASALAAQYSATQANNQNVLANAQLLNAQFNSQAANAEASIGQNNALRAQQGYQWDYEKEAAAYNAMVQAWNTGAQNLSEATANYIKQNWDRRRFEDVYKLYAAEVADAINGAKNKNGVSSLGLGGDISSSERFEKYAPSPFTPIRDVWTTPKAKPWNPAPNIDVPFANLEKLYKSKSKRRKK